MKVDTPDVPTDKLKNPEQYATGYILSCDNT